MTAASLWQPPDPNPNLEADTVDIWLIPLDRPSATIDQLRPCLSADELERSRRFLRDTDREHYIIARAGLRHLLASYLKTTPGDIRFGYTSHGKPFLADSEKSNDLCFNLSHSRDRAVLAITREKEIGIDIEYMRDNVQFEALARRFFSPNEASALLKVPPARLRQTFFRIWTRKEAYIKARGDGLSLPLDQFDVFADPLHPPALLATRHDPPDKNRWHMAEIDCGKDYACALAVAGKSKRLRLWRYEYQA